MDGFHEQVRRTRCDLAGFEDDAAAGADGRGHLGHDLVQWEVPWRDCRDDPGGDTFDETVADGLAPLDLIQPLDGELQALQ